MKTEEEVDGERRPRRQLFTNFDTIVRTCADEEEDDHGNVTFCRRRHRRRRRRHLPG